MSETLNVNVLVAAKDEYTRQLVKTIKGEIYDVLKSIFSDSQDRNVRRKLSYSNFQIELKLVPEWTAYKLDSKVNHIPKKYPFLMDLITAIFVSHVKILACVRLKSDNKSIKIKVPNLNTFLHKLLIRCSETLYYEPSTIETDKYKVMEIIETAIDDTIAQQIPIEYILQEYLSGAFDDEPDIPISSIEPNINGNGNGSDIYNDNDNDNHSDQESVTNSEDGQVKNIPILPIKSKTAINNLAVFSKPPESDTDQNELKDIPNESEIINKSSKIEDSDEDYSDDEVSADESEQNEREHENENEKSADKNKSLF
jgi:hypothetical protein